MKVDRDEPRAPLFRATMGLLILAALTMLPSRVDGDGIEVRGPGCIGICHDGSCCGEWITLNDRGTGFARSFNCVAFMERATAAERAWICGELRKKNKVCPQIEKFCASEASCGRQFKNCADAEQYIDRARTDPTLEVGEASAYITPTLGPIKVGKQPDGRFKAEVTVTWSLDSSKTTMTLPDWCWPNMTAAEKSALKSFVDALKVHEEGHVTVTKDFGEEISGSQSAVGPTEQQARSNLQTTLNKYTQEKDEELQLRTKFYDQKTDHGAKQSAGPEFGMPGGRDAILTCP